MQNEGDGSRGAEGQRGRGADGTEKAKGFITLGEKVEDIS